MLTKNDLSQIRSLMQEEIRKIIREEVPPMIQKEIDPLTRRLDSLEKKVDKGFKQVEQKINIVISGFDSEILDLKKRLN